MNSVIALPAAGADKGFIALPDVDDRVLVLFIQDYLTLLRIDRNRVCLDIVTGLTDGTPHGTIKYQVRAAGQNYVSEL